MCALWRVSGAVLVLCLCARAEDDYYSRTLMRKKEEEWVVKRVSKSKRSSFSPSTINIFWWTRVKAPSRGQLEIYYLVLLLHVCHLISSPNQALVSQLLHLRLLLSSVPLLGPSDHPIRLPEANPRHLGTPRPLALEPNRPVDSFGAPSDTPLCLCAMDRSLTWTLPVKRGYSLHLH